VKAFREKIANRDYRFRTPAIELYELLLLPAAHELDGITKLVIVPDAALWELPFQVLITSKKRYLLEEKTVSFIASLTVLQEMMNPKNKKMISAPPNILAFGNPALGKNTLEELHSIYRSTNLDALPEAEKEAKRLGQLYGGAHSKVYIGAEAHEGRFKAEAGQFRILHLATHSILNDASPMYSQIVLAQTGTDQREDGLLEAREVLNMSLSANIVVLSSCESALGKVGRGEGMIGLAWAFFVAGTSTTVVSQWKVASASTTEFMLAFHEKLKYESKAEALRNAALELSKQTQYRHPFYWAPFVLIGIPI
jgi:CHAT domain-containing protein